MTESYLLRAKLADFLEVPQQLPVKFGPFLLNYSPNNELWCIDRGFIEPDAKKSLPPEDRDYPLSLLYVDTEISVRQGQRTLDVADDILEQLEAMLRLFQDGDIYLRRHQVWKLEKGTPEFVHWWLPWRYPIKAEPATLYSRSNYKLDDETLGRFINFFNSYWGIVHPEKPQPLYNALFRFSSSYEKRTLADRLVELVIAMEALFGGKGELTYKISLRSACLLYPAGEARRAAFDTIKKLYDERSDIVHGKSLTSRSDNERIDKFEDYVRNSIVKFLELHSRGHPLRSERELDELLFFTREAGEVDAGGALPDAM